MQDKNVYVLAGAETRYVLKPFAEYLKHQGEQVVELDTEDEECVNKLLHHIPGRTVYITSDHIGLDRENLRAAVAGRRFSVSNLEIIKQLKPVRTVLYTHDLGQIIGVHEDRYLDLFDIVLFPYICNDFYFVKKGHTIVEETGWIRKKQDFFLKNSGYHEKAVYFPSNMALSIERYGIEGYADWIERTIDTSVPIKPSAFGSMEPVLNILEKKGYHILDKSMSVYDVMETADLIITNGCSSIVFEAAYSGCPVVSVLDGFEPDVQYRKKKPQVKWVYSLHPQEVRGFLSQWEKGQAVLEKGKDILKPFDFEKAYRLAAGKPLKGE